MGIPIFSKACPVIISVSTKVKLTKQKERLETLKQQEKYTLHIVGRKSYWDFRLQAFPYFRKKGMELRPIFFIIITKNIYCLVRLCRQRRVSGHDVQRLPYARN